MVNSFDCSNLELLKDTFPLVFKPSLIYSFTDRLLKDELTDRSARVNFQWHGAEICHFQNLLIIDARVHKTG